VTSTFIALPLTSGEAFLLRTEDAAGHTWTILVDGGKKYGENSRELVKLLSKVSPRIDRIDIVVCTHSDADHSQGLWHLPEDWYGIGRTIGEFWLPGRWANAMPRILTDPAGFAATLVEGAVRFGYRLAGDGREGEERLAEALFVSREHRIRNLADELVGEGAGDAVGSVVTRVEQSGEWVADDGGAAAFGLHAEELSMLRASLDESDEGADPFEAAIRSADARSFLFSAMFLEGDRFLALPTAMMLEAHAVLNEVAETAKAIRKIATAALNHRIGIRWFDFGEYEKTDTPSGGVLGVLEPWCSVEVVPDRAKLSRLSALALVTNLRLTRQNVESLVFYRPETDEVPGVLFLGDSRLAHGINKPERDFPVPFEKPTRPLLVTAPHHGSDHNDNAYEVLDTWLGRDGAVLIRNGGQSNQRLAEFVARDERRCAQCVQCNGKDWNQWVSVMATGNTWHWPPSANACGTPKI
jgi:hypothetical protein